MNPEAVPFDEDWNKIYRKLRGESMIGLDIVTHSIAISSPTPPATDSYGLVHYRRVPCLSASEILESPFQSSRFMYATNKSKSNRQK